MPEVPPVMSTVFPDRLCIAARLGGGRRCWVCRTQLERRDSSWAGGGWLQTERGLAVSVNEGQGDVVYEVECAFYNTQQELKKTAGSEKAAPLPPPLFQSETPSLVYILHL
jgi:hypothetical protein